MNGEMDFMILNNKVKGVQGTVDNIDEKIDSIATESSVQNAIAQATSAATNTSDIKTSVNLMSSDVTSIKNTVENINNNTSSSSGGKYVCVSNSSNVALTCINSQKSWVLSTGGNVDICSIYTGDISGDVVLKMGLKSSIGWSTGSNIFSVNITIDNGYNSKTLISSSMTGLTNSYKTFTYTIPVYANSKITINVLIDSSRSDTFYCNLLTLNANITEIDARTFVCV